MVENITYSSYFFLALLFLPVFFINKKIGVSINKQIVTAFVRMIIQLILVGLFLEYIFDINSTLINLLYVIVMITAASYSAITKAGIQVKKLFKPILIAFMIPNVFMLFYLNFFVLNLNGVLDARFTIPIAGMILGNSLTSIIMGLNTFYTSIKTNENEYLYMLSLSCNRNEAIRPYFKNAVSAAMSPALATIETMGIVALPGMMTGQILGGASPFVAIKYQIVIMVAIFTGKYFGLLLTIKLTSLKSFDKFDRVLWVPIKKKGNGKNG